MSDLATALADIVFEASMLESRVKLEPNRLRAAVVALQEVGETMPLVRLDQLDEIDYRADMVELGHNVLASAVTISRDLGIWGQVSAALDGREIIIRTQYPERNKS